MFTRSYFPNFDKPFNEVIYPKGDPDAVSISKRDIDLLQPNTFVNDTIIDFYIKYLRNRQNGEERVKFHFFNSFFFRKLAEMDKDPSSAFDGKAAFHRVRKLTRKVNLLEQDFIFIPVNYNQSLVNGVTKSQCFGRGMMGGMSTFCAVFFFVLSWGSIREQRDEDHSRKQLSCGVPFPVNKMDLLSRHLIHLSYTREHCKCILGLML